MDIDSTSTVDPETAREIQKKLQDFGDRVRTSVRSVVVGMDSVLDQFLIALLAGGHVLLEGVPGTAKTTLAKAFAHVLGIEYHRVQFTPDLLPSDITGTYVFDRKENDFVLRKGPLFCQLLLADEVNRSPAKTQAALLEAMQENQVTIEGTTLRLPKPFMVLATQNPVEQEGVYRLPEAQLDRFLIRVEVGYPTRETEVDILKLHSIPAPDVESVDDSSREDSPPEDDAFAATGSQPHDEPSPLIGPAGMPEAVFSTEEVLEFQSYLTTVYAEPDLMHYIVDLARASRQHPDVSLGASPRASVYLLQCARARALLSGRHYATHEDVHAIALAVLGHRLILYPEAEVEGRSVRQVVDELLDQLPVLGSGNA